LLGEPSTWTCDVQPDGSIYTYGYIQNNTNRILKSVVVTVYVHDANRDFLDSSGPKIIYEQRFRPGEYSTFNQSLTPSAGYDRAEIAYCSWHFREGLGGPKLSGVSAPLFAD
tara:strand:- start:806 stop:1141 length:336 start_codon:yes stop_codon:yes gene_type:complete